MILTWVSIHIYKYITQIQYAMPLNNNMHLLIYHKLFETTIKLIFQSLYLKEIIKHYWIKVSYVTTCHENNEIRIIQVKTN